MSIDNYGIEIKNKNANPQFSWECSISPVNQPKKNYVNQLEGFQEEVTNINTPANMYEGVFLSLLIADMFLYKTSMTTYCTELAWATLFLAHISIIDGNVSLRKYIRAGDNYFICHLVHKILRVLEWMLPKLTIINLYFELYNYISTAFVRTLYTFVYTHNFYAVSHPKLLQKILQKHKLVS